MSNSKTTIKVGKGTATATYRRLDAVAKPGAKVGHHDFVEHPPTPLDTLRRALKGAKE